MAVVKKTSCGANVRIGAWTSVTESSIGACSYVSHRTEIFRTNIGKFCSIGHGCRIGVGIHPTSHVSTSPVFYSTKKQAGVSYAPNDLFQENREISIGHDVFVGANAVILDGVNIGTGAVIGAGSVVTRDVAPYTLAAGVPALPKKKRFSEEQIAYLLGSCWWDWSSEQLSRHAAEFSDARRFIDEVLSHDADAPKN
jgi:acetyltransferase-like isoleucine patch superfamily enzyme